MATPVEPAPVTLERAWFRLMHTFGQVNPSKGKSARIILRATRQLTVKR
jgi:hypothetical protein